MMGITETVLRYARNYDLLLKTVIMAYKKHHLNDDSIGWEELGDYMGNTLMEVMGDDEYQKWMASIREGW